VEETNLDFLPFLRDEVGRDAAIVLVTSENIYSYIRSSFSDTTNLIESKPYMNIDLIGFIVRT
jgi:hypothetical protein